MACAVGDSGVSCVLDGPLDEFDLIDGDQMFEQIFGLQAQTPGLEIDDVCGEESVEFEGIGSPKMDLFLFDEFFLEAASDGEAPRDCDAAGDGDGLVDDEMLLCNPLSPRTAEIAQRSPNLGRVSDQPADTELVVKEPPLVPEKYRDVQSPLHGKRRRPDEDWPRSARSRSTGRWMKEEWHRRNFGRTFGDGLVEDQVLQRHPMAPMTEQVEICNARLPDERSAKEMVVKEPLPVQEQRSIESPVRGKRKSEEDWTLSSKYSTAERFRREEFGRRNYGQTCGKRIDRGQGAAVSRSHGVGADITNTHGRRRSGWADGKEKTVAALDGPDRRKQPLQFAKENDEVPREAKDIVDLSHKYVLPSPEKVATTVHETDPHRLGQRQKQIDYGKNTLGYERYLEVVPRNNRRKSDPGTPDIRQICSKRSWDGQIRKWRRLLHAYDLPVNEEDELVIQHLGAQQ